MTAEQATEMLGLLRIIAETNSWSVDRAKRLDRMNDFYHEMVKSVQEFTELVHGADERGLLDEEELADFIVAFEALIHGLAEKISDRSVPS